MNIVAWVLGIILVAVFAMAGATKVLDLDRMREHFGYTKRQYQVLGLAEIAAAVAVVIGLLQTSLEWIALAAAAGICALMLGALMAHARVGDETKKVVPALVVFVLAIVFMITISLR